MKVALKSAKEYRRLRLKRLSMPADTIDSFLEARIPGSSKTIREKKEKKNKKKKKKSNDGSNKEDEVVIGEIVSDLQATSPKSFNCTKRTFRSSIVDAVFVPSKTRQHHKKTKNNKKKTMMINNNREKKENELRALLDRTGSYPERLRFVAWRWLLCLPNNVKAFEDLEKRGRHESLSSFESTYPIRDRRLQRRLLRLLSALAHWGVVESSFLASMIFPLAKVCGPDLRLSFELIVTMCMHWSRPLLVSLDEKKHDIEILHGLDACLSHHDKELWLLLRHFDVDVSVWALQPLQTIFAEIFQVQAWLQLWDFLITSWRRPEYFALVTLAFVTHCRASIVSRIEDEENGDEDAVRSDLVTMFREHRLDLSSSEKSVMSFCRRVVRLYETTPEHIVRKLWWGHKKRIELPFMNSTEDDETYIKYRPLREKDVVDGDDDDNDDDDDKMVVKEEEEGGCGGDGDVSLSLSAELLR